MVKQKETWRERLVSTTKKQNLPKVSVVEGKMTKMWGEGTVVIPSPVEVDALMKKVARGKLMTINQIREFMANKYHATFG
jgi:hypothetical protein